jgi:sulfur carrier protein
MRIFFNEEIYETASSDLHSLLKEKKLADRTGIAVAVNDFVVTSANWPEKKLSENDKILVITAAAGG